MTTYEVTIRATVTKTLTIEAASKAEAEATAHDLFTTECDGTDERYEQETLDVTQAATA